MRDERVAGVRLVVHPWISVLTTPARPDYTQATLDAIDAAGGADWRGTKLIAVDGDHTAWDIARAPGWTRAPVGVHGRSAGTSHAMLTILSEAARDQVPFLLYFEDDIALCRNAIQYMAAVEIPGDCAFLTFCDIAQHTSSVRTDETDALIFRAVPTVARPHWGCQALKIPLRTLERVAALGRPAAWYHRDQSDVLLGALAIVGDSPFVGIVSPSIVDHVGARSLVHPGKGLESYGRRPHDFPGMGFDAMSLEVRE